jgi:iron-sulfur cluster repair protein YtfE (RIC family)
MQNQFALSSVIRCILKANHSLLRKEVERAAELTASVVVEQRPPLCRTLFPLDRLFQEFRRDLEDHLDAQDARLFPHLLDLEDALCAGAEPVPHTDDISEGLRLLKYGQTTLTRVIQVHATD